MAAKENFYPLHFSWGFFNIWGKKGKTVDAKVKIGLLILAVIAFAGACIYCWTRPVVPVVWKYGLFGAFCGLLGISLVKSQSWNAEGLRKIREEKEQWESNLLQK